MEVYGDREHIIFGCEKKKADDTLVIAAIQQEQANRGSQLTQNLALANLGLLFLILLPFDFKFVVQFFVILQSAIHIENFRTINYTCYEI